MNPLWIMGLLLVGSVLWLVLPLCWKPDRPLPAGIEDEASERHQLQAECVIIAGASTFSSVLSSGSRW